MRREECELLDSLATVPDVAEKIYPPTSFAPDAKAKQDDALRATNVAQPAIGAVSLGAWRVLSERFGLTADAFAGHSYGELTALAAAHYVEAGKWSLDENINDKLVSWKLPENEYTKTEKVTLRRLLSHSAGTTVHGFPGYAVTEPLPTVQQVLDGAKPANTAPVRVDLVPGTKTRYSGGGTTIVQVTHNDEYAALGTRTVKLFDGWLEAAT